MREKMANIRRNNENTSLVLITIHSHQIEVSSIPRSHNKISLDDGKRTTSEANQTKAKKMGIKYDTKAHSNDGPFSPSD